MSAGIHKRRTGKKDGSFAFIDSKGKKVRWQELIRDGKCGCEHFWEKRGGPLDGGADFKFGD